MQSAVANRAYQGYVVTVNSEYTMPSAVANRAYQSH